VSQIPDVTESSGNVFADLGLPEPEIWLAKAQLVHRISEIIEDRGWDQGRVAEALGIDQPTISALLRGYLDDFSIEQLFRFLNALDQEVEILVGAKRSSNQPAGIVVTTR
jgi:predicted XRE-type DNA-binding protein